MSLKESIELLKESRKLLESMKPLRGSKKLVKKGYKAKLSKQQKLILSILKKHKRPVRSDWLSMEVAEKFDNNGDRILDHGTKDEYIKEHGYEWLKVYESSHKNDMKRYVLTQKHRASMSRSLRRLKDRGLIKQKNHWQTDFGIITLRKGYCLTEEGIKFSNEP